MYKRSSIDKSPLRHQTCALSYADTLDLCPVHTSPASDLNGLLLVHPTSKRRHNERDGVSNHRRLDCLLNRISKKTSKLRVIGLCEGNPPVTDGFPSKRASSGENLSIWWHHHMSSEMQDVIIYPFLNFNGATVEVWKWIRNFIPHFIMVVITYPCRDWS